jgi:hypothetical protein
MNGYLREFEVSNRHLPYEVFAVAAECRLLEETWDEFMVLHVVHGSLSASKSQTEGGIQISRAIIGTFGSSSAMTANTANNAHHCNNRLSRTEQTAHAAHSDSDTCDWKTS